MLIKKPWALSFCLVLSWITIFLLLPSHRRHAVIDKFSDYKQRITTKVPEGINVDAVTWGKKDAYGLFLVTRPEDGKEDPYYNATRSLVFQLLHNPATKDDKDVLVLASQSVPQYQIDRLRKDGAIVRVVEPIPIPEGHEGEMKTPKYIDMMTKLRFWQQTDYRRIYVMDSDVTLLRSLKFVWNHSSVDFQNTIPPEGDYWSLADKDREVWEHNITVPSFVFSSGLDAIKQDPDNLRFCAGLFIMSPDNEMFERLMRIRPKPDLYGGLFNTEQNLLNYAFRPHGRTPWRKIHDKAAIQFPGFNPLQHNWASVHLKYWETDSEYGRYGRLMHAKMLGYYLAKEGGEYYDKRK